MKAAAQFFKVLGDEARLKLLWLLFNQPELCVCDLMAVTGLTQSKVSRHLATLRHAGLVVDRKDGLWSYYAICPASDGLAREHIELLRESLARRPEASLLLARLRAWLGAKDKKELCSKEGARLFTNAMTGTAGTAKGERRAGRRARRGGA